MHTGSVDSAPARVARCAPAWLDDPALDALLATPVAADALADLHARPELPPLAREALGQRDEEWVRWLREPPGVALGPERVRALCRRDGELWSRLCAAAARSHGREPLAVPSSAVAIRAALRDGGGREGRLWLGLLFGGDERQVRPLIGDEPRAPRPADAPPHPGRRRRPAIPVALAGLALAWVLVAARPRHCRRGDGRGRRLSPRGSPI